MSIFFKTIKNSLILYATFFMCLSAYAEQPFQFNEKYTLENPEGRFSVLLHIEHAETNKKRIRGLMHVKKEEMLAHQGMLFVWEEPSIHYFWMKNTEIPLDILYFKENKVVGILKNMTPYSLEAKTVYKPADKALEVNAGFVEKYNVSLGWTLKSYNYSKTN